VLSSDYGTRFLDMIRWNLPWLRGRVGDGRDPAAASSAASFISVNRGSLIGPDEVTRIIDAVRPFTMVHDTGVAFLIQETVRLIQAGLAGMIVECGVWRGGCALAALLAQRAAFREVRRPVYLLDSFEGLPPVTEKDGPLAASWQTGVDAARFLDNCRAAEDDLRSLLAEHGFAQSEAIIIKGWFRDTLPAVMEACRDQGIALLRLDGDWYDSTLECLTALEPLVSQEGTVIVDDYYAWDGCALAVHDYLSRHGLSYRIKSLPYNFGMYFVKRSHRTSYEQF
jgi:O-methyltransferase